MLVGAHQVQKLRSMPSAIGANDIIPFATPWHCLVCCNGYATGDLPARARAFWLHRQGEPATAEDEIPELTDTPPNYVSALMRGELLELPNDPALRTVTVFKELDETVE
jgi:hypothetical protein